MDMAVKPRLGIGRRIGPDVARVAVRQIKGKEVCFLLDAADYNKHFTKIGLCMTGRMAQRHEHLLAGPLPVSNVIPDDGVAAIKTALVPQPLENTLCSVTLLARAAPVFSKPLVHLAGERIQLRAPDRRCPPISRRLRIGQHLRYTVPADPKIPGNLASAQSILEMSVTHLQIQIHGLYPQALPKSERAKVDDFYAARDTTTVPLPWPSIAPPFTLIGFDRFGQSAADKVSHPCDGKRGLPSLVRGSFLLRPRFDLEPGDRIENLARKCPCKLMKLGNHLPQIAKALDGLVIRDAPGIHSILPMIAVSPCVVLGDLMHVLVRDDLREDPCGVLVAVAPLPHLILVLPFHLVLPSLLHDLWHIVNLYMGDVADPERRRYFGRICRNTIELLDPGDQFLERPGQEALDRNIG